MRTKASKDAAAKLVKPYNLIPGLIVLGLVLAVLTAIGMKVMGANVPQYLIGFIGVFVLCVLANALGAQKTMKYYGLNAEIWSIILGLVIANTVGTPKWMKPGVQVEYFIKTGLVLLGAEVLFNKIVAIGVPGHLRGLGGHPIVLISTFIFGQKVLKMPFQVAEHRHLRRYVRVRHLGRHRHRRRIQGQKGGIDPGRGTVPHLYRHHDGRHPRHL